MQIERQLVRCNACVGRTFRWLCSVFHEITCDG